MAPARLNRVFVAAATAAWVWAVLVLPLVFLPRDARWGWTLVPITLLSNSLWALIHEAIHGKLAADRRWNHRFGRLLGWGFGSSFAFLRVAHLQHHVHNRGEAEQIEVRVGRRNGPWAWTAFRYYFRLCGGLYYGEALAPYLAWLPAGKTMARAARPGATHADRVMAKTVEPGPQRREVRVDAVVLCAFWTSACFWYGEHFWMLSAFLKWRAFAISFLDYIYHYGGVLNDFYQSFDLRLPRPLAALILNFNYHGLHHREPDVPWDRLPRRFAERGDRWTGPYWLGALRQLRGPLKPADLPLPWFRHPAPGDPASLFFRCLERAGESVTIHAGEGGGGRWILSHVDFDGTAAIREVWRRAGLVAEPLRGMGRSDLGRRPRGWRRWRLARAHPLRVQEPVRGWLREHRTGRRQIGSITLDETETQGVRVLAKTSGVGVSAWLLGALQKALRPHLAPGKDRCAWVFPVNLRGSDGVITQGHGGNDVAMMELLLDEGAAATDVQAEIRRGFSENAHWANWAHASLAAPIFRLGGGALGRWLLSPRRGRRFHRTGTFSQLGEWRLSGPGGVGTGWWIVPPVTHFNPLVATVLTVNGRMTLALHVVGGLLGEGSGLNEALESWKAGALGRVVAPEAREDAVTALLL